MKLTVDITKKLPGFTLKTAFESKGDVLGLLGASGSGKSMTLRCIAGLETPDKGEIILNGRILYDSEKGINLPCRKRKAGFLFQNYALFPHMTVAQNIGFALQELSRGEREQRVMEKIRMMHLEGYENRYPSQLSGGQQQRVALARSLAIEPEALLLDEPFSALDNHLRDQLEKQLMETLSDYHGVTVFVSHNMDEVYRVCKNLVILSEGNITASGDKQQIFENPPTYQAAQLTGCKNLSRAKAAGQELIEAIDWGCKLYVDKPAPSNFSFIGIRAHHLSMAKDDNEENVYCCRIANTVESPYTVTVYLKPVEMECANDRYTLQWEISKEKWNALKEQPLPWRVKLDPAKLFVTA